MMHDPFQNTILGSYYGTPAPIGLQYPQTPGINPAATLNPLLGLSPMAQVGGIPQLAQSPYGQSPYGQNPGQGLINPLQLQQLQQLQLASLLASQAVAQNPVLASLLSNPLIAASLHSQALGSNGALQFGLQQQPSLYPQIGQIGSPFGQNSPFGQIGSPFGQIGYPLAPQSWIGQGGPFGGVQQGFGQINPFQSQLTPRPFQGQGLSPWGY